MWLTRSDKMYVVVVVWLFLAFVFAGAPLIYFLYMRFAKQRLWNLEIHKSHQPKVTILVPMYNEEKTIRLKLENLTKLRYPREKLQILLVNDASTDDTLKEVSSFLKDNSLNISKVDMASRQGKTRALNLALDYARGEIMVVSDSDAFISPDILNKAMPFFADPTIGALVSREKLLESHISWVSQTEEFYYSLFSEIKLGESKVYSTIMFHGGFAAYRKTLLDKFNVGTDDSGTALDIVQKGYRTIMIPEAVSFGVEFLAWKDKLNVKVRRATHKVKTWTRCLHLLVKRKLLLPKKIALPGIFLHLFNPIVFLMLFVTTIFLWLSEPLTIVLTIPTILSILAIKRLRTMFIEVIQNNFFLLLAILSLLIGKEIIHWKTVQDPRAMIRRDMLEKINLI